MTTAYVKHDSKAAKSAGLHVEPLPPIDVKSGNASMPDATSDANDVLSFAALSEELELSQPEGIKHLTEVAPRVVSTPYPEAPAPKTKPEAVVAEHASPQMRRPSSTRPARVPHRASVRRQALYGLLVVGAVGLVLALRTYRNGSADSSALARLHNQWTQAHQTIARMFGRTTPMPKVGSAGMRRVDVSVVVEPPEARLYLDGRVASNPLRVAYPADNTLHVLRAEADGRLAVTQSVKFDRDVSVELVLGFLAPEVPANAP